MLLWIAGLLEVHSARHVQMLFWIVVLSGLQSGRHVVDCRRYTQVGLLDVVVDC